MSHAMTVAEVRAIVDAEIAREPAECRSQGVDLNKCLVIPRPVECRVDLGTPFNAWIVLEESPGTTDGYLIIFDECERTFGLADGPAASPMLVGIYGSFLDTLRGM